jgi:hypothetical protein
MIGSAAWDQGALKLVVVREWGPDGRASPGRNGCDPCDDYVAAGSLPPSPVRKTAAATK